MRRVAASTGRAACRLWFHLFFRNKPGDGEYCNSKTVRLFMEPAAGDQPRPYLAIIRCGATHQLIDDGSTRQFDIALNLYAPPAADTLEDCEYAYSGGLNKYKAARQFIDNALLDTYAGFIFLDDDLEISWSDLSRFLGYCSAHQLQLAQPSLTRDSFYSHDHLLNAAPSGTRTVRMVEVMCPYFSRDALRMALGTFDLSYSTWGLDELWSRLPGLTPVVVDDFTIRHTRPVSGSDGAFYRYMRRIGVSPMQELRKFRTLSEQRVFTLAKGRTR